MEGPSVKLAAERFQPFIGRKVLGVAGDMAIGKERLEGKEVKDVFSWGKHLVFQFDTFALRIHMMLIGTYEATVEGDAFEGDYKKRSRTPTLAMTFKNGRLETYNAFVKWIEDAEAKKLYDFSVDTSSRAWDGAAALKRLRAKPERGISDALLDQDGFSGLGNIIRNEALWRFKIHPDRKVGDIPAATLRAIVKEIPVFCRKFYTWRKNFVFFDHMQIYKKETCPRCGAKVVRTVTGKAKRWSYICPKEQR
jgi:endonuclease-8